MSFAGINVADILKTIGLGDILVIISEKKNDYQFLITFVFNFCDDNKKCG